MGKQKSNTTLTSFRRIPFTSAVWVLIYTRIITRVFKNVDWFFRTDRKRLFKDIVGPVRIAFSTGFSVCSGTKKNFGSRWLLTIENESGQLEYGVH